MSREVAQGKNNAAQEGKKTPQYWIDCLSDCETECEPEPDCWDAGGRQSLSLSVPINEQRLAELCHAAESTTQAFFTAAFAYLAAVFTAQDDILFRTILPKAQGGHPLPHEFKGAGRRGPFRPAGRVGVAAGRRT